MRSLIWGAFQDAGPIPALIVLFAFLVGIGAPLYAPPGQLYASHFDSIANARDLSNDGTRQRVETTERSTTVTIAPVGALRMLSALPVFGLALIAVLARYGLGSPILLQVSSYAHALAAICTLLFALLAARLTAKPDLDQLSALSFVAGMSGLVWFIALLVAVIAYLVVRRPA